MSYPRADFPPSLVTEYQTAGLIELARQYGSSHNTIRRWLKDRGVVIRRQGPRIGVKS